MLRPLLALFGLIVLATPVAAIDDHLVLTEAVVTPTEAEYLELANPTGGSVTLTDYYLSDDLGYALLPGASGAGPAPSLGTSDFIVRFPSGATIAPGQVVVVAFDGVGFLANFGFLPDYEIRDTDPTVPDMIALTPVASAGLTNSGESAVLFYWDGASDLVTDVDMLNIGTPSAANGIGNKTGVSVDGPDVDTDASTYLTDAFTMPLQATDPGAGTASRRILLESGQEATGGGNGITGDDETTENILVTWDVGTSSPGFAEIFGGPMLTTVVAGIDLWKINSASVTFGGLIDPLPGFIFGPVADDFIGTIDLTGSPLQFAGGEDLVPTASIIERLEDAQFGDAPSQTDVAIELVALSLVSTSPISVVIDATTTIDYDVQVVLSEIPQLPGTMTLDRNCVDGGTFAYDFSGFTKWIFTPVGGGTPVVLDFGLLFPTPIGFGTMSGHWTFEDFDPSLGVVGPAPAGLQVDKDLDGTFEPALPAGSPNFSAGTLLAPCDPTTGAGESVQSIVDICVLGPDLEICICAPVPPPPACEPPTDLVVSSNCDEDLADLSWVNSAVYASITILQDGSPVATLPGDSTAFSAFAPTGVYTFTVVADCGSASGEVSAVHNQCPQVAINELRIDQPSADDDEYFELAGDPGTSLDGLTYVVIGDGTGGSGVLESATDLSGHSIGGSGLFLVAKDGDTFGAVADLIDTGFSFENSDNVTHLLVAGFTGATGDDLDSDDDGILDVEPWTSVVDCVALVEDLLAGELVYCTTQVGPVGTFVPGHALRCGPDWGIGPFDPLIGIDSPGAVNGCPDCDGSGTADAVEIAQGTVADCDADAVPDSCQIAAGDAEDCDLDGVIDACAIAADPTLDCNENGRIDSCEIAAGEAEDCNGNGIIDSCDIAAGTPDVDGNGIPDECEGGPTFVRGDCNGDGGRDIADAIYLLAELFTAGPAAPCADACDANDDGGKDIADAVYTLAALFSGGPTFPAPNPDCGQDPTDDGLDCLSSPCP